MEYNGVINIYKERGLTSRKVSSVVGRILGEKSGHAGTLDPDAEGVLPVCVGKGTKLYDTITGSSKQYVCECTLGVSTDSQDSSGKVISTKETDEISADKIKEAAYSFIGGYMQLPPMFSAIKINGKRLYDLAREGKEIEREPRFIEIHGIEILEINNNKFKMSVDCGKGSYIRTLCADIGDKLGCGGHMSGLIRTKCGIFTAETAVTLEKFKQMFENGTVDEILMTKEVIYEMLDGRV